jgi:peptidoglycan/LPS O-acetylase OafA/YrhL
MSEFYLFPMHIVFSCVFLLLSVALSKYQPMILVNPISTYIGKVSFSMYIVHFSVLHWLKEYNFVEFSQNTVISYAVRFFVATFISVVVATIFYHTVEVPFQQLGKKLIDKLEAN